MNKKQKALAEITIIYLIVGVVGWATYHFFENEGTVLRFIYADLGMTIAAFFFSLLKRNSSVYDAYWTVIPFYFIVQWFVYFGGTDWEIYQWICAFVVSFCSLFSNSSTALFWS